VFFFLLGGFHAVSGAGEEVIRIDRDDTVPFSVARGEGMAEIAQRLEQKGLIKSAFGFKIYSLITGQAARFKPGVYRVPKTARGKDIVALLVVGNPAVKVTIPEGATVADIDAILAEKGIMAKGELIEYAVSQEKPLEGFLFPDTYTFSAGTAAGEVVRAMRANFDKNIGPLAAHLADAERNRALIVASLVEKEARYPKDRVAVASVIRERLKIGMPLQLDAANVYVKCKGAYITCPASLRALTKADLTLDGPYNTYAHAGLPQGPIANPGVDAFRAALSPKGTANLYYISNPQNGRLIFAETLDEHNENRQKYH
jgi:UPF0755 protein